MLKTGGPRPQLELYPVVSPGQGKDALRTGKAQNPGAGHSETMNADWKQLKQLAQAEVDATLAALPAPLRERAARLPVTLERGPNADFVAEGIEADSLGLFTGPAFGEEEFAASPVPPQIILFLENLWDYADGDEEIYLEEVHTTYLHELGHYLGLDEDDLTQRGLD